MSSQPNLSPGCSVPGLSLRAALTPRYLADPAAAPGPTLTPSSRQDVALPPCKVRAPFCKAQSVRSTICMLNKSKKYVGIALSAIIFAPTHVLRMYEVYYDRKLFC